jgi:hypothetical protein
MRVNLTISFDPEFIARMDQERGDESRGAAIEARWHEIPGLLPPAETVRIPRVSSSPKLRSGVKPRPKGKK